MSGTAIGHYQIGERLGAGGMGEVYRARDTRLGREVAIKVLSPDVVADDQRRARLDREARLLAALNHPHIASIYGVEYADGAPALVLELVDGETLTDRLARGALPIREAVAIAIQIALALEAAHERGIIHRDLKPANIKITSKGVVKVLDFGIAKALDTDVHLAATQTALTRDGVVAGTSGYMSPEQARGQTIDARTDVWAFGCVLFELLTGRGAFDGQSSADRIASILEREPNWQLLPRETPPRLRLLLLRLLRKDPQQRLQHIGDARIELQELDTSARGVDVRHGGTASPWALAAGAALFGAAIVAVAGSPWGRSPAATISIERPAQVTTDPSLATQPALSADGRLMAYASDRAGHGDLDIWVRQLSGGAAIRLTSTLANESQPSLSPDGSMIAFRSDGDGGGIYVMPALGGDARLIARGGFAPRFSPDGKSIVFWRGAPIAPRRPAVGREVFVVPAIGGAEIAIARALRNAGDAVWAPDGKSILLLGMDGDGRFDWYVARPDGGEARATGAAKQLAAEGAMPWPMDWTRDGVYYVEPMLRGDVWLMPADPTTAVPAGLPIRLTAGAGAHSSIATAADGVIAFSGEQSTSVILGLPLDAAAGRVTGTLQRLVSRAGPVSRASMSLDGRFMTWAEADRAENQIMLSDLSTNTTRQLVLAERARVNPVIASDGSSVAYTLTTRDAGYSGGPGASFIIAAAHGTPRKICDSCEVKGWLRGERVLIERFDPERILVLALSGGVETTLENTLDVRVDPTEHTSAFFDGRLVVAPFTGRPSDPDSRTVIAEGERSSTRATGWSPDGRLLYVLSDRDGFRCLYAVRIDPSTSKPVGTLFNVHHFHDARYRFNSTTFASAVVQGWFVSNQEELAGNIWTSRIVRR